MRKLKVCLCFGLVFCFLFSFNVFATVSDVLPPSDSSSSVPADSSVVSSDSVPLVPESTEQPVTSPVFSFSEPLPVMVVEPDISLYSVGSIYPGSISTTYLTYAEGLAAGLSPFKDCVFWRSGQYEYTFVSSDSLLWNGHAFSAGACDYTVFNTRDYISISYRSDSSFYLNPGDGMVYTSLEGRFPILYKGVKGYEIKALLFVSCFSLLFSLFNGFFNFGGRHG